jgi:Bifunctional DNA primase/polymerase, N-terminal
LRTISAQSASTAPASPHDLHNAAHALARRGWQIFPCLPGGKTPATPNGFYAATTNPATIDRWWRANPDYNVAIRCGAGSGLWVVDLDGSGADVLRCLSAANSPLPATLIAQTASGWHLYLAADRDLPSTAGKIGPGIDTRGRGGYVIGPPSRHPSGAVYRWVTDLEPVPPPKWLIDLACKPSNSEHAIAVSGLRAPAPINADAYGQAAPTSEIEILATTPQGARNHQLNASAFSLFQLVGGGVLAEAQVTAGLVRACQENGLWSEDGAKQCWATIASGAKAGLQHPRGRP